MYAKVRKSILPDEWQLYLESWISLAEIYLRLGDDQFVSTVVQKDTVIPFLISFFRELASDGELASKVTFLRRKCFFLLHRVLSQGDISDSILSWSVLSDICRVFPKSEQFRTLLQGLWKRKGTVLEKSLQTAKTSLIRNLESKRPEEAENTLDRVAPLIRISSDASIFMLTGSDFLDSLSAAYPQVPPSMQKKLVTIAYLGLTAALGGPKPNYSLLSDHLYSLKSSEEQEQKKGLGKNTLVADLVTNTPLLEKIFDKAAAPEAARVKNTAASLSEFRQSRLVRPKRLIRRKVDKGKEKVDDSYGHGAFAGEVHVHRMSMISQIQDLFPDLGAGFIVKCLNEYNDDIEQVTAHLLEDSLPPYLAEADHSEKLPTPSTPSQPLAPPRSSQHFPERRNVFDNDEFDKLAIDTSRLHIGRRGQELNADKILSDRSNVPAKSAIMAALAVFDSDDDERDDTYDAEDVGASVDTAAPEDADLGDKNEEALFRAYTTTPELFGRESEMRRGKERAALKSETGMTDEAIEGWAIMMGRNPKQRRRLEAKFSNFQGQQRELQSTAWRDSPVGSGDEGSGDGGRGGRGGGRGRGRGRGRGGRNASVAGPADDKGTQISRQRKEANKSSSANHNRKAQRGKKMARAGFPAS
ncbi:putative CUE3 [Pyrenophora seminiperda CCB06]|uniref:Putative CUE3 n=1 Tax=Pyrenophora seminiperda CCB06 TaxID=1302712 RepID=A0A3M7M6P4_9PLEO|nr:putative CUE3 [Pyrenophora seminiperda CCB06]